jgi:biotin operon repressor
MPAKITIPFTKEELQKEYEKPQSLDKIAQKYKVSKKYVLNYMKAFGIPRRDRKPPIEEIRKLAENWFSAAEIAIKLGYSLVHINKTARTHGISIPNRYHPGHTTSASGYLMVRRPDHPFANCKGYIMVHRLVMESHLGRILRPYEVVHHQNENRRDNRIENLLLMTKYDHKKFHSSKKRGPRKTVKQKLCAHGDFTQTGGTTFPDR